MTIEFVFYCPKCGNTTWKISITVNEFLRDKTNFECIECKYKTFRFTDEKMIKKFS